MAIQYCNYDIKGTLAVSGTSTLSGIVTITEATSSPLLNIYNTSNGSGATIRFSDQTSQSQTGDITFYHSDGSSQGGGASWHFVSQPDTVLVVGNSSVNGRFVAKSAGSVGEVDYGFFDDVNTGMVRTSADNVSLVAGGVRGIALGNATVSIRYAGSTKLSTVSGGVDITGNGNFSGDITVSGGDITLGGTGRIQGVDTVSSGTDAANKTYVDNAVAGVPQGTVTKSGTPVNNQLAVWTSSTNIEGEPELTYDGSTFTVGGSGNTTTYLDVKGTNTAGSPATASAIRIYGYEGRGEGIFYYDSSYSTHEWYSGLPYSGGSTYQIGFHAGSQANYVANGVLRITSSGQVQFNNYGQSSFSGTVTTFPAFTGDGQIVDRTPAQVRSDIGAGTSSTTGTVTSVGISHGGNAFNTGSAVTTSGTLAITMAGSSSQYVNGAGNLTSFPSIPSAANNAAITIQAGTNLTTGGTFTTNQGIDETITINMATGGVGAGTYGSTSNSTKIDNITVDAYGRVTAVTTGATGQINTVATGNANTITVSGTSTSRSISANTGVVNSSSSNLATGAQIQTAINTAITGVLKYDGVWNASTNSPTLSSGSGTVGEYYIVSVAGSTNLDGITDWAVGDWAVFSDQATDAWQKIDNTQVGNVTGSGSSGRIPVWNSASNITSDSGLTFNTSSNLLTIGGQVNWSGGSSAESNTAYDNMITGFSDSGSSTITLTLTQNDGGTYTTSFSNPQGTVTAVKATTDGNSLGLSGAVTSTGTLTLPWQGSTSQYVRGDGSLSTFPAIPSVGNGTLTMTTSTGLDGGATFTANQSGNSAFAVTLDLTEVTMGTGLDSTATGITLDLSEFGAAGTLVGTDEFIVLDGNAERKKAANAIGLSIFNNDAGFITSSSLPSVGNGQINGATSGLGLSGSMSATANQSGNTTFTVTSNASTSDAANTIAYRNGSADITARLFRATYANQSTISGAIAFRVNNSSDNYTRYCSSPSAIRSFIGAASSSVVSGVTSVATGNGISGGTITSTGTLTVSAGDGLSQSTTGLLVDYLGTNNIILSAPSTATGTLSTSDQILVSANSTNNIVKSTISNLPFTNNAGDITAVVAGNKLTGGGTSGSVTLGLASNNISQWTNNSGYTTNTGTVTSIKVTTNGTALGLSGSVSTSGTCTLPWAGTSTQYVTGNGGLKTFPSIPNGTVTSVATGSGLTGGTITGSGTISVDYSASGLVADAPGGAGTPDSDDMVLVGLDSSGSGETVSFALVDLPFMASDNTSVTNWTVSSTLNVRGAIDLADNDILRFGTSDDIEMYFSGSDMFMDINNGEDFKIRDGNSGNATRFTFDADTGNFTATGNITAFSDERLKDNIETLDGSKVLDMRGVSYTKDGKAGSGVIAQEIEKVAPELVMTNDKEDGMKSVAYGNLVGYLIEAVKDQQKQIDELKSQLDGFSK